MKTLESNPEILDEWLGKLTDGRVFMMIAASERSTLGYKPPPNYQNIAALYKAAGKLAGMGDNYVPFAMALARAGGQYQSHPELLACAYEAIASVVREGYTDVIRLASPEPGRRKDAQRPFTVREILTVSGVMHEARCEHWFGGGLPGVGWVEAGAREKFGLPEFKRPDRNVW